MVIKLTVDLFIEKARKIHSNKYNYDFKNYSNCKSIIKIECPNHGWFEQIAKNHIVGYGCSFCGEESKYKKLVSSKEEFVKKAILEHGHIYDYSKVIYVNSKTKIEIICKKHGSFWQKPNAHLAGRSVKGKQKGGSGCPKCFGKFKYSKEEFIEKANLVHDNKYDYSKIDYKTNKTKIIIICNKHGEFKKNPKEHLKGSGCPSCSGRNNEKIVESFLIKLNIEYKKNFKVSLPINIKLSRVDFYIEKFNLFIEYNGEQHYQPVLFGNKSIEEAEIALKKQQIRDEQLRNYCKENNINLLEIDGRKYQGYKLIKYLEEKIGEYEKGKENISNS